MVMQNVVLKYILYYLYNEVLNMLCDGRYDEPKYIHHI